jgi:cell division protein FtsI/penicillin-binding protein 2
MQRLQWRSKSVNDTYEPGSTYKILTLSMALEENLVGSGSSFHCTAICGGQPVFGNAGWGNNNVESD